MSGRPTPGRVVHYVSHGTPIRPDGSQAYTQRCRAATVTEVGAWLPDGDPYGELVDEHGRRRRTIDQVWEPEACALNVQNPTGLFFNTCRHDEGHEPGTWHWPERVEYQSPTWLPGADPSAGSR